MGDVLWLVLLDLDSWSLLAGQGSLKLIDFCLVIGNELMDVLQDWGVVPWYNHRCL